MQAPPLKSQKEEVLQDSLGSVYPTSCPIPPKQVPAMILEGVVDGHMYQVAVYKIGGLPAVCFNACRPSFQVGLGCSFLKTWLFEEALLGHKSV